MRINARSVGVGIWVPQDHKKLRIRTTLSADNVDELIGAWPEDLKLRPIPAIDPGAGVAGEAPSPPENQLLKYGVPIVVAFITAVSVSGMISMKKAIWPSYSVVVVVPNVENGVAKSRNSTVSLSWYLKPSDGSLRDVRKDVTASISIQGITNGFELKKEAKPPLSVQLGPGDYDVIVDVPDATPAHFELRVESW